MTSPTPLDRQPLGHRVGAQPNGRQEIMRTPPVRSPWTLLIWSITLLAVRLHRELSAGVPADHTSVVYVLTRDVVLRADGRFQNAYGRNALAVHGGGQVVMPAVVPSDVLFLSGPELHEPGAMGHLAPLISG